MVDSKKIIFAEWIWWSMLMTGWLFYKRKSAGIDNGWRWNLMEIISAEETAAVG